MPYTVRQARMLKGMSQRKVAGELKVSNRTYCRYEKNAEGMPAWVLTRFSMITNIPIEQIIIPLPKEERPDEPARSEGSASSGSPQGTC